MTLWTELYRRRDMVFGRLPEPQWRILLDLAENGPCRITSAAIASGAPLTTVLRHIELLQDAELIKRQADKNDRRSGIISLTGKARQLFATLNDTRRQLAKCDAFSGAVDTLSHDGDNARA